MISVRIADISEIRKVAEFMTRFEQATEYVKVNVDHTTKAYENLMSSGASIFFVLEDDGEMIGGLGAIKYPDLHSGELTAVETFWFVDPQHRGKGLMLLDAFEKWARRQGCKKAAMIHLSDSYPEVLERLYKRRGYKLVEKHFVRCL